MIGSRKGRRTNTYRYLNCQDALGSDTSISLSKLPTVIVNGWFQEPLYKSPLEGFEAAASATSGGDVASPTSQRLSQVYETFTAPVDTGPDGGL